MRVQLFLKEMDTMLICIQPDGHQVAVTMKTDAENDSLSPRFIDCAPGYIVYYPYSRDWQRALVDVPSQYKQDLPKTKIFLESLTSKLPGI